MTSRPVPVMRRMTAREIVDWARDKEVHAVLKIDMAAGILPSGRIGVNGVRLELAGLAMNLTALLRRSALGERWFWRRVKSLRGGILLTLAQISTHAGQILARVHTRLILEAHARLAAIPPPTAS